MAEVEYRRDLDRISRDIADFTVGFVGLSTEGSNEDAHAAGSGTLIAVGSIKGILTAAHVLDNLPDTGEVGLLSFPRVQARAYRQTIDMSAAEKLLIGSRPFGPMGPDLGFLRLGPRDAEALEARNVFFNLGRRRALILAETPTSTSYFDGLSGVIAEWTTDSPTEENWSKRKDFFALYGTGIVVREHMSDGFDLVDFEVSYDEAVKRPNSYKGMSGGSLWRVYGALHENGRLLVSEKRIFGVAFFQSERFDNKRIITCHGPMGIYGHLIDAISDVWPSG